MGGIAETDIQRAERFRDVMTLAADHFDPLFPEVADTIRSAANDINDEIAKARVATRPTFAERLYDHADWPDPGDEFEILPPLFFRATR